MNISIKVDNPLERIRFNRQLPEKHRLSYMCWDGKWLHMENCDEHCLNWREVIPAAVSALWEHGDRYLPISYTSYASYVLSRCPGWLATRWMRLYREHVVDKCTPVKNCHGDMTLSNVMIRKGDVVFIDPGKSHGLPCREIDEAKLLQSYRGWHWFIHKEEPIGQMITLQRHRVLLLSHYIRILHHLDKHPPLTKTFVLARIKGMLNEIEDCNH